MTVYRRGSKGPGVSRIQAQVRARGLYLGPADGDFGGGTESAVLAFQRAEGIVPDGLVGPETWSRLFGGGDIPAPAITAEALDYRSLALTGAFETDPAVPHSAIVEEIFGPSTPELRAMLAAPIADQLVWATSIQDPRRSAVNEPWRGRFKTLGRREDAAMYQEALTWCGACGVVSERAVALLFDIRVQNGSISALTRAQIQQDFARIPANADSGLHFDLAGQYGIGLRRAAGL